MAYKHYWISRHYASKLIFHKMSAGHVGVGNAIPFVCRTLHILFLQIKKITYKKNLHYHESEAEMFFISIKSPYRTGRTICMCCTFHLRSGLNANAKQRKCLVEYRAHTKDVGFTLQKELQKSKLQHWTSFPQFWRGVQPLIVPNSFFSTC